jgi:hypothetical protein
MAAVPVPIHAAVADPLPAVLVSFVAMPAGPVAMGARAAVPLLMQTGVPVGVSVAVGVSEVARMARVPVIPLAPEPVIARVDVGVSDGNHPDDRGGCGSIACGLARAVPIEPFGFVGTVAGRRQGAGLDGVDFRENHRGADRIGGRHVREVADAAVFHPAENGCMGGGCEQDPGCQACGENGYHDVLLSKRRTVAPGRGQDAAAIQA